MDLLPVVPKMAASDTKPKVYKEGEYNDPVYKKLARINGEINKLGKTDLQDKLYNLGLDHRGVKEVLRKRLKNYYRKRKLAKAKVRQMKKTNFDYFAVIDFEATCEENNIDFHHEIIEFPIILVDLNKMEIVEKFHEYVRPVINPKLTKFCSKLTGISQATVDAADTFPEILDHVEEWLRKHSLGDTVSFAVLTDGPWDMYRFMYNQCEISQIPMPRWSKQWVNIRKAYSNFYQCRRGGIEVMLSNLGMKFEGKPHSGIDDATNIARIALKLMADGCNLTVNEYIQIKHVQHSSKKQVRYEAIHESDSDNDERETRKKDKKTREPDIIDNDEINDTYEINTFGSGDTEAVFQDDVHTLTESKNSVSVIEHTLSESMKKLSVCPNNVFSVSPNNVCEEHDETLQELIKYYKSQNSKS